jgi:hypothetical protein
MIEREYVIRFRLPKSPRARWAAMAAAGVLALSAVAWATVPNVFVAGEVLSAAKLNANFADLDGRIDAFDTSYCGATSKIVDARIATTNGYATAKTLCQTVPGCGAHAHMCTSAEMLRYTADGNGSTAEGWIATGIQGFTGTYPVSDCDGFTSNVSTVYGTTWSGFLRNWRNCSTNNLPVLCCD